jgi:hypothetical protein
MCRYESLECDFYTQSVISTRTSVIPTSTIDYYTESTISTRRVWFYTPSVVSTHTRVILNMTLTNVIYTSKV